MKLELKHLAPYLPYALKYIDNKGIEQKIRSLSGELELIDLGWGDAQDYKGVKLVLRPLSDLNKQNILDMLEYSDFENVYHCGNPDDLIFINTEDKNYLSEMLKQAEFLFKKTTTRLV